MLPRRMNSGKSRQQLDVMVEKLRALNLEAELCGVLHIINDGLADIVQSDETRILYGQEYIMRSCWDLNSKYQFSHFFRQIH